ncbi:hypothetical protein [Tenacibaculum sp.]|uniref:hypothetical protein n=1 Tax=Tenacibaculum sp. TaxID=1906242 RepID=UPI003AA9ACC1
MKSNFLIVWSLLVISCSGISQEVNLSIEYALWNEDVTYLKKKVEEIVPQFKTSKNKVAFEKQYNNFLNRTKKTLGIGNVFELQKILNTLGDEGCTIPLFQKGLALEVLPIKTYWFNDGLYVLDAAPAYKEIVGEEIVKINTTIPKETFKKVLSFLNADNNYYQKHLFQLYGFAPLLLKHVGLGASENEIVLQLASGKSVVVKAAPIENYAELDRKLPNDGFFSHTNKNHSEENYWLEFIPNTKTLFIQLQKIINNDKGDSFSDFIEKVEEYLNTEGVNKLIIDLRYGGGGNGFKLKKFTDLLKDSKKMNRKGNLFVLTSKATRGSLVEFASILSINTKAILVGEPTAEGPNTVGDIKYITLPNSGVKVSLTHTLWPTSWKSDTTTFLMPSLSVIYNYQDKVNTTDPWLTKIQEYKSEELKEKIPKEVQEEIIGSYRIAGRRVTIERNKDQLFFKMSRRMRSFFEINTELYFHSEGRLSTDIEGVFIKYEKKSDKIQPTVLQWKQVNVNIQ